MQVETSLNAEDMKRLGEAIDNAHRDQALKLLANPVAVHVNMLRGIIAKPSWQAIEHLYPEASALAAERDAATARAEFLRTELDLQLSNLDATKRELADLERHFADMLKQRDAAIAERDRMREALEFYADVHKYPSPLTGGMGALWSDCGAIARAALTSAKEADGFPQPGRRDGKEPCGECRIKPGETCDICGAKEAGNG